MSDTCAIIAGAGLFPHTVAREAKRQGLKVVAIGLRGWVNPNLAEVVDVYEEVAVGELGQLITRLKTHHAEQVVMAGKVTKDVLFDPRIRFDAEALALLTRVRDFSVNGLLGAIASQLAQQGITLLDSSTFLKDHLCPLGALTKRGPTADEQTDIRLGMRVARALAEVDVGQTVVVKRKVVVAVEALEGTDAAIRRAGQLAPGGGLVVVKMASPKQDMRFDLPVFGPQTITALIEAGASCVALEMGKVLLLEQERLLAQAISANMCLIGIDPATPSSVEAPAA